MASTRGGEGGAMVRKGLMEKKVGICLQLMGEQLDRRARSGSWGLVGLGTTLWLLVRAVFRGCVLVPAGRVRFESLASRVLGSLPRLYPHAISGQSGV